MEQVGTTTAQYVEFEMYCDEVLVLDNAGAAAGASRSRSEVVQFLRWTTASQTIPGWPFFVYPGANVEEAQEEPAPCTF